MSAVLRAPAPKSIPHYQAIATILSLADNGTTGAVADQGAAVFDLQDTTVAEYHEGLLRIEVKTTNGQGGTPTAPGASTSYTIHYAFSDDEISAADAPTVLQNIDTTLVCNLPNSSASTAAGIRYHATDPFVSAGRYLYVWYDRTAFSANALVDLTAKLVRC